MKNSISTEELAQSLTKYSDLESTKITCNKLRPQSRNQAILAISILCLFSSPLFTQTTYNISDPEALENQTYQPGDEIILANGTYNTDERINFIGDGTSNEPIVFRAENPGGVTFTGGMQMNIGGDYVIVDGFHWQGGFGASNFIQFRNGTDYANYSTIQNCAIDGLAIHPEDVADDLANNSITKHRWIVLYGTYNTITNCSFINKESAGALVLAEYQYNSEADPCAPVGHTISNNYFYKYKKVDNTLSNAGDSETIRIGASSNQNINSNATVKNNYFVESDGENEIITNKSKGNNYINNTFRRCRGSLVLRHGSNTIVDGNYFLGENIDGTGGIRITDSDHTITNNYIQDCITVESQAKWNNGITFLGGGDAAAVACSANNLTNGYQKSENINLTNNTIINTNAPLFYNTDKGSNDPTGLVLDNLIYFASGNANLSNIISGDTPSSYTNLGTALTYSGNVYAGATLGELNSGFSLQNGIMAALDGEIFGFSGSGATGKGADMGTYTPATNEMVGRGIGACYLDHLGAPINDGDCTIITGDQLLVGNLPPFLASASSKVVTVNANISWSATSNNAWVNIDTDFETGSAAVTITVAENTEINSRIGTVTFTQAPGGADIVKVLTVTQQGVNLTDMYDLINVGTGMPSDKVQLHSFSKEEVDGVDKFNYAANTLDKDNSTVWAADDDDIVAGDYKGDGEYIIYDLSTPHTLDFIQFTTTNKTDAFGFQVWTSITGTDPNDFSLALPSAGDLLLTATNTTDFNQYEINPIEARYVKLIGYGRFNEDGNTRLSVWSAIGEIEFYGTIASSTDTEYASDPLVYPVPAQDVLRIENLTYVDVISIYSIHGKKVIEKNVQASAREIALDVSLIPNGSYIIVLNGDRLFEPLQVTISR